MTYPEQHIQELVKTINTLRAERDEARRTLTERRRERDEAIGERDEARRERDSARREVCRDEAYRMDPLCLHLTPQGVAEHRGWDCFKENTDD